MWRRVVRGMKMRKKRLRERFCFFEVEFGVVACFMIPRVGYKLVHLTVQS